jgi:hypothetical protein
MWGPPFWNQAPSLAPFTMSLLVSPWVWVGTIVGLFVIGLVALWPRVGLGGTLILVPLLLMWEPVPAAIVSANVNGAVFGLLALALRFPRVAGLTIGLAAALKFVPVVGVAWLIGRRDWSGVIVAVGIFLAATGLTAFIEGPQVASEFIIQRINEWDPRSSERFGLAALGISPAIGYGVTGILALLAMRFASFTLATAAMLMSVPAPHLHYWTWALVPALGIGLPRVQRTASQAVSLQSSAWRLWTVATGLVSGRPLKAEWATISLRRHMRR